jgi:hypothetical protein
MAKENETDKILGNLEPDPGTKDFVPSSSPDVSDDERGAGSEEEGAMTGGSQDNPGTHSGARDVTGSVTGGTESGGVRNLRQGSGHSGGDIGNRPEVKRAEW